MNKADNDGATESDARTSIYRGSQKHKNRPTETRKGTLCPEWTHRAEACSYGSDPFALDWTLTEAHRMFAESIESPDGRRRFATGRGIAFEAKPTHDGTWHGYPVPWENVPAEIVQVWRDLGKVSRRDVRLYRTAEPNDIRWALRSDAS